MSAPVDVLAVMLDDYTDASIERMWYDDAPERAKRSEEARAAVAELIEAATFARHTAAGPTGYTPGADRRLAAAIARVQGGGPC